MGQSGLRVFRALADVGGNRDGLHGIDLDAGDAGLSIPEWCSSMARMDGQSSVRGQGRHDTRPTEAALRVTRRPLVRGEEALDSEVELGGRGEVMAE